MRYYSIAFVLSSILCYLPLQAYQPKLLQLNTIDQATKGDAKNVTGQITLMNNTQQTLYLTAFKTAQVGYAFSFIPQQKTVGPKQSVLVRFRGRFQHNGKFQVLAKMPLSITNGRTLLGYHTLELYYHITEKQRGLKRFRVSTYQELFLTLGQHKEPGMGTVFKGQKENPRYPKTKPTRFPKLNTYPQRPDRDSLYKIPTHSSGKQHRPFPNRDDRWYPRPFPTSPIDIKPYLFETERLNLIATIHAQGTFSWLGTDNHYHPAFGWRVRAWTRRNASSSWTKRAEDWIQWDGSWQLQFHRPSGHRVKFQYIAYNRFFEPQTNGGSRYRWVGPEHTSLSSVHNEGSWSANTSSGNARGLGEMYHEGMRLWSKLYWTGQINPLRNKAIRVVFPNLTYDCGDGSGNPWSCANTGGNIWLIPAHALAQGVMAHELSHQINYEFWNNNRPPNSGGSHTLTGCFTPGLALLEGFADFMESWLYDTRSDATPNASGINLELVPNNVCQQISRNETYVAATFWDLYDQHTDNKDRLWFIHPGAVPGIYLRTGKKNSMDRFRSDYRSAANAEHRSIIDHIFQQNNNFVSLQSVES